MIHTGTGSTAMGTTGSYEPCAKESKSSQELIVIAGITRLSSTQTQTNQRKSKPFDKAAFVRAGLKHEEEEPCSCFPLPIQSKCLFHQLDQAFITLDYSSFISPALQSESQSGEKTIKQQHLRKSSCVLFTELYILGARSCSTY